jgi:SAM-dependent methyltransferase
MFRHERTDPDGFYTLLADDAVSLVSEHCDVTGLLVVDLGGGPGYYARAFREAGARAIVIDIEVSEMTMRGPVSYAVAGSVARLPVADASVDLVFSSNLLEHVRDVDAARAEMERVVKPGGLLVVSYTNWLSPWGGHETSPWHYLGGERAARRYQRRHGRPPKNRFGTSLYPVSVAAALRWARSADGVVLADAVPRYLPGWTRPVLALPAVREVVTWNLLLVLRKR